jgi:hypothetical protein
MSYYEMLLVICSVMLVIVGFGQLRFIRKSLAVAELTAQAAMKSAEAAKESSKAMVAVELPILVESNKLCKFSTAPKSSKEADFSAPSLLGLTSSAIPF